MALTKEQEAFLQRTRQLHKDMLAYDAEVKKYNRQGIGDSMYSIIQVDEYGTSEKLNTELLQFTLKDIKNYGNNTI